MVAEICQGTFVIQILAQLVANQHDCVSTRCAILSSVERHTSLIRFLM